MASTFSLREAAMCLAVYDRLGALLRSTPRTPDLGSPLQTAKQTQAGLKLPIKAALPFVLMRFTQSMWRMQNLRSQSEVAKP